MNLTDCKPWRQVFLCQGPNYAGADPGFLERGFICIEMWGVGFVDFISFFLNIPWKCNNLVSVRPNYYIFIGYLKMGDEEGSSSEPSEPPSWSATDYAWFLFNVCFHLFQCTKKKIPLTNSEISESSIDKKSFAFTIKPKDNGRTYYIQADSELAQNNWMQAICFAKAAGQAGDHSQACSVMWIFWKQVSVLPVLVNRYDANQSCREYRHHSTSLMV